MCTRALERACCRSRTPRATSSACVAGERVARRCNFQSLLLWGAGQTFKAGPGVHRLGRWRERTLGRMAGNTWSSSLCFAQRRGIGERNVKICSCKGEVTINQVVWVVTESFPSCKSRTFLFLSIVFTARIHTCMSGQGQW